ncbi:hypothetical protein GXM_03930 [Nostoc sphaeroides CCNUC1]|uniref:Uncharacterized protein n=1 Tax=Nostoc sphaeroides CCNUC1 TaxID=2653204 RepID=A0A5P8W345_9NOSO|nr:hypothetical protein GXM_03930 [Nostoc sphaeroides CCNUC1]
MFFIFPDNFIYYFSLLFLSEIFKKIIRFWENILVRYCILNL